MVTSYGRLKFSHICPMPSQSCFCLFVPISIGFPFETLHLINVSSTYICIYICMYICVGQTLIGWRVSKGKQMEMVTKTKKRTAGIATASFGHQICVDETLIRWRVSKGKPMEMGMGAKQNKISNGHKSSPLALEQKVFLSIRFISRKSAI